MPLLPLALLSLLPGPRLAPHARHLPPRAEEREALDLLSEIDDLTAKIAAAREEE